MSRRSFLNLKGAFLVVAVALVAVAGGARPASAQVGPSLLGTYQTMSNHSPVELHIVGWAPLQSNNGVPRVQITGFIAEANRQDTVFGEVSGNGPYRISFRRGLGNNGIVQQYSGAVSRAPDGRWVLAGTFTHNSTGPWPWF